MMIKRGREEEAQDEHKPRAKNVTVITDDMITYHFSRISYGRLGLN